MNRLILLLFFYSIPVHAGINLIPKISPAAAHSIHDYRVGDEWGKKKVTPHSLKEESPAFVRASKATAYLPVGGTGFYLGKFAGHHVMVTNYHVCKSHRYCIGGKAFFKMLDKKYKMSKFLLSEKSVDLALISIEVPPEDEFLMSSVAKNFSFNKPIFKGQELITVGFGIGGNWRKDLMGNQDRDCKVFSETENFKFFADPDELNPGGYKAWSFAHGCDISHGDSGSAMVDRTTGDVLGIVWTGKIPKSRKIQKSSYLDQIFQTADEDIWRELSYAVPAKKIGEYLIENLNNPDLDVDTLKIIEDIMSNDL